MTHTPFCILKYWLHGSDSWNLHTYLFLLVSGRIYLQWEARVAAEKKVKAAEEARIKAEMERLAAERQRLEEWQARVEAGRFCAKKAGRSWFSCGACMYVCMHASGWG